MLKDLGIIRSHILLLSILPLTLNILITPMVIMSVVSLPEYLKNSTYYIYTYGLVLWSGYHVFLAWLAFRFFRAERQNIREIVGPLEDKFWHTI